MLGLIALVCLPWLNPLAGGPSPAVVPLLVSFVCTGILLLRQRVWVVPVVPTGVLLALGLAMAWHNPALGGELLLSWACLLVVAACMALGAHWEPMPAAMRAVAWAWLAAALISSGIALIQFFGWAHYFDPWISQSVDGTAYGNLRQRNQLATLTCIGLAALLWLLRNPALSADGNSPRVVALHRAAPWMVALLVSVNAATTSRAGLSQLVLLLLLAWFWRADLGRPVQHLLWFVVPVYALAAWLLPWIAGASQGGAFARIAGGPGCASRLNLWANVGELIAQKPWVGWGWRELAWAHYETHFEPRFCQIVDNAHNLPLHLAVELGVPVALLACTALLYALWRGKPWRETNPTRQLAWSVLLCIGVHSMVEYPLWYGPFQMAAGLAVGLLWRNRPCKMPILQKNRPLVGAIWSFVAIILIAPAVWAAWEYQRVSQIYLPLEDRQPRYRDDTLAKIGSSWLFDSQLQFARLSVTPLTAANAPEMRVLAQRLMHYSPEPRVIEVLIESASLMGDLEAALAEARRYKEAFPKDYAQWKAQRLPASTPAR